jgi:hypothetical protein
VTSEMRWNDESRVREKEDAFKEVLVVVDE